MGQERLQLAPRLLQLFVLQLQLNLVDLEFVDQPLRIWRRSGSFGFRPLTPLLFSEPRFRAAAQLGRPGGLILAFFHGWSPLFRQTLE